MRLPWRPVGMWPDFGAAVAVAVGDAGDGQARHQEGFEHAVLDELDAPRGLALVVKVVVAAEPCALELGEGGIVGDAEERRQNRLAEQLGEGLALLVAALPLAFEPVAEHLVEEDRRGASAEDGRPVEGFRHRRDAQRFEVLRHRDGLVHRASSGRADGRRSRPRRSRRGTYPCRRRRACAPR